MQSLSSTTAVERLYHQIKLRTARLVDSGIDPHCAVILVGEDPESLTYVSIKEKRSKESGIILSLYHLEGEPSFEEISETIGFLAADSEVHGIVLQLPLPPHLTSSQTDQLIALIPSAKDVDGLKGAWKALSYTSADPAALAKPGTPAVPPMVLSVLSLLQEYNVPLTHKKVVLVGRGRLVGAPLEAFFTNLGVQVQAVDEETENIIGIAKQADILITGTGQKDLITYQWVKEGAVVIDCAHDVHYTSVEQVASALTPEKGGTGPLTVAWLLSNVLDAAEGDHV